MPNSDVQSMKTEETLPSLQARRRDAVRLRLAGETLAAITSATGLSSPTIIAAHKAYLQGGWPAVEVKSPGRPRGEGQLSEEQQDQLRFALLELTADQFDSSAQLWHATRANAWLQSKGHSLTDRSASKYFDQWGLGGKTLKASMTPTSATSAQLVQWHEQHLAGFVSDAKSLGQPVYWVDATALDGFTLFRACSTRKKLYWHSTKGPLRSDSVIHFLQRLLIETGGKVAVILKGVDIHRAPEIKNWIHETSTHLSVLLHGQPVSEHDGSVKVAPSGTKLSNGPSSVELGITSSIINSTRRTSRQDAEFKTMTSAQLATTSSELEVSSNALTHLQRLEAESIHIMREVIAESENPVMLYSIGKDSAVMLHLALKAFYPAPPPFPLLHVDTTWKFRAMYEFREQVINQTGMELLTHTNQEGIAQGVNPFTHGSGLHTDIMKTEALKQALNKYGFDAAFGGARRDEEKSRAKERIFSFRSEQHRWEPKNQRPELWNLYNARKKPGETIRVFPLSNWTELDIWQYIHKENISIVPLYMAAERPVVERDGTLIMVDDDRMPMQPGEVPMMRSVRFRTLGCYPLTGAIESTATTLPEVIQEMLLARTSERQGRMIDHDAAASMEKKKQEGYF